MYFIHDFVIIDLRLMEKWGNLITPYLLAEFGEAESGLDITLNMRFHFEAIFFRPWHRDIMIELSQ